MKIDELIQLHFYDKKEIRLQGLGTFRLTPAAASFLDTRGEGIWPENAITFEHDPKAREDPSLIETIAWQTKKIKTLASSDLNSFVVWETQLLNIGMTFTLPGIGSLEKTKEGEIKFTAHRYSNTEAEKKKVSNNGAKRIGKWLSGLKNYRPVPGQKMKKALVGISLAIVAGAAVWILNNFMARPESSETAPAQISAPATGKVVAPAVKDTSLQVPLKKDSQVQAPLKTVAPVENVKKEHGFKIVFLETRVKEEALKKYNEIIGFGHTASMYMKDSSVFQIAFPFNLPLGDTSRIVDSLDQFYSLGKGFVDSR